MSLSRLLSGSFYHNNLGFTTCPRNGGNFKQQFNRVKGFAGIAQVLATIEAEPQSASTKKAA
jgi:hypothetical protein